MIWTIIFAILTLVMYIFLPHLDLRVVRKALGITLFLELFYLIGHYMSGWPFPGPLVIFQIVIVVFMGAALGVYFSRIWPLSPKPGFERIIRTFLIVIPALGLGVGLQVLLQGNIADQGIFLIFALSAWLGSGHFIRQNTEGEKGKGKNKTK